ncbi:helix-turn-helix domain-containing protein [Pseudoalteromonas sp. JBTF-M23]|uniref:Helix-turn-helix domain-containing protein n=1 Tax=Pseudoalteromonas caenipelagi TaxID=2726988 RepID=A0A849VAY6_9GAMM|nr:helix-turn-helix domain-containing protein [Pseudoalteromonas caenipelagi]NOU50018.1 helix-turn-helix domain-containing protein [Pseudoalteromonas caenipelagi]
MILKQLRLSRHLTQDQLADMAGLNVRTIQRIESGQKPSIESLKCLASALDVDIEELQQEQFMISKNEDNWRALPLFLKVWFVFNFLQNRPTRRSASRVQFMAHVSGFLFCCLGFVSEAALAGGLILLASAYLFNILIYQGDKYGIWYDTPLD